jgi:hypothetical protein
MPKRTLPEGSTIHIFVRNPYVMVQSAKSTTVDFLNHQVHHVANKINVVEMQQSSLNVIQQLTGRFIENCRGKCRNRATENVFVMSCLT